MPVNDFSAAPLSWQPKDVVLSRPKYLSLAARLEKDIDDGILPPGTRLPPQRLLADFLDLNFTTVTRAYDICRARGIIYGITGRGTFVSPHGGYMSETSRTAVDLGAVQGFASIGTELIIDAAKTVLNREYTTRLFSYGERDGSERHRAAGAYWLNLFKIPVSKEQVAVFPGAQNALTTILLAFFRPGDSIAVDEFTYSNLIGAAHLLNINLVAIKGDGSGMSPAELERTAGKIPIRGIFLMPVCANPTTVTMPTERIDALSSIIRKLDLAVIEDNASLEPEKTNSFFARLPERTFFLSGNTRFISPGLRVAFAAYPPQCKDKLLAAFHRLTIKTSSLDTEIMSELILDGRASDILKIKIRHAAERNAIFEEIFPYLKRKSDDIAFFRTIPLPPNGKSGHETEQALAGCNINVCHSYRFAANKRSKKKFLRVSLSSTESTKEFTNALRKLEAELRARGENHSTIAW